jgi:phosphoglycolate phosphatase-like HAD superfamily hydrolase
LRRGRSIRIWEVETMSAKDFLVASDFDGVMWDSVDECFHVGMAVFGEMEGKIDAGEEVLMRGFRQGRFLARTGDDFYILLNFLREDPHFDFGKLSYGDFVEARAKLRPQAKVFVDGFYRERKRMRDEEPERWKTMHRFYPGVMEQLAGIQAKFLDFVICTTKDEKSVSVLLESAGLKIDVYGRELSTHKPDQMAVLTKKYGIPHQRIIFIDDMMENLITVRGEGVNVAMASWGYNTPGEVERARGMGIPILGMQDIAGQLESIALAQAGTAGAGG